MKIIDNYILNSEGKIKQKLFVNNQSKQPVNQVMDYLTSGNPYVSVSAILQRELCEKPLTRLYFTDGKWMWGKWLLHYVQDHQLLLPEEFLRDMDSLAYHCPKLSEEQIERLSSGKVEEIPYF